VIGLLFHNLFRCAHGLWHIATDPAESLGASFARFSNDGNVSRNSGGSAFAFTLFEACSAFSHFTVCILVIPCRTTRLQPLR